MDARFVHRLALAAALALGPAATALAGPDQGDGAREDLATRDMPEPFVVVALLSTAVALPLGAGAAGRVRRARQRRLWRERDVPGELRAIAQPWRAVAGSRSLADATGRPRPGRPAVRPPSPVQATFSRPTPRLGDLTMAALSTAAAPFPPEMSPRTRPRGGTGLRPPGRTSWLVAIALLAATPRAFAGTILPPDAAAPAPALQYLADAPFQFTSTGNTYTGNYGNNFASFNQNLIDQGLNAGTVGFEYNTYAASTAAGGKVPDPSFVGGATLSGLFTVAPNVTVPAGDQVAWVQVVTTNVPGAGNIWGATANQPYPDVRTGTSPNYPFQFTDKSGNTPAPQPSAGYTDTPFRPPTTALVTNWQAELGLALENPATHVATILGTFTWGFIEQAVAQNAATQANVLPIAPYSSNQDGGGPLTPPSPGYLSTLMADFDGNTHGPTTSTKWTFDNSQHFLLATPEPASLVMAAQVVLCGAGYVRWRRRRAARARSAGRA